MEERQKLDHEINALKQHKSRNFPQGFLHCPRKNPQISFDLFEHSLHEKCPYSELFWSVFSRIQTE